MIEEALKIKEIAGQAGQQNGCRIYDIYKHRDRLQIFIDKKAKNQVVNLKDCENVFHSLHFLLHTKLPHILEKHRLEVSSPGIEKQLREKWHFEESIGKFIKIVTHSAIEIKNTKTEKKFFAQSFKAQLVSISEKNLNFKNESFECDLDFSKIKFAKLIFNTFQKTNKLKPIQQKKTKRKGVKNVSWIFI